MLHKAIEVQSKMKVELSKSMETADYPLVSNQFRSFKEIAETVLTQQEFIMIKYFADQ